MEYIVLLRGINVGGHKKVKIEILYLAWMEKGKGERG